MNYFSHSSAAERYARFRPYFHPVVVERICRYLQMSEPVPVAVDVACGTGQSSLALTEAAESVVAIDLSADMLSQAPRHPRIRYLEGTAENLPLEKDCADLMTVFLAFHWFDRASFLGEARRVLRPGGALVVVSNGFFGAMRENPDFAIWNESIYLVRYPSPPRNHQPLSGEDAQLSGFRLAGKEAYTNEVSFSPEQLAQYLMTQSNVIARVEQGEQSITDVHAWLVDSVSPFFPGDRAHFRFGGEILFLRPENRRE